VEKVSAVALGSQDQMYPIKFALQKNSASTFACVNRGLAWYYKKDYPRARADWEKALLQLNPNDANARNNLEVLRRMEH
jgi:tetratricopeptide (TPR) repeat protein